MTTCRVCGELLGPQRSGQERYYCSAPCRRRAEFNQRRQDRLASAIDRLEVKRTELEADRPSRRKRYQYEGWKANRGRLMVSIEAHRSQLAAVAAELDRPADDSQRTQEEP